MNTPTLSTVMNGRLPGIIGECAANLGTLRAVVNEAQERLLHDPLCPEGGWYGGAAGMAFTVQVLQNQGYLVMPHEVARITDVAVCNRPVEIRNGLYEYLLFGTGLRDLRTCCDNRCQPLGVYERDSVTTLNPLVGVKKIQVSTGDASDYKSQVCIQGLDANRRPITTLDVQTMRAVLGEYVSLEAPFSTTVNQFSKITGILKGATLGAITFDQLDPATGDTAPLSVMEPWENSSLYRRYLIGGLSTQCAGGIAGISQVNANVRLELIPAMSVSDRLLIQSVPALLEECQSLRYSSMDSQTSSAKAREHHAAALRLLFGQLDHYYGKNNVAVSRSIFGTASLRHQPV